MERYVDLADGKIFVSTYGDEEKFPLVLLHGNSEDSSYFIHQIEYFSDKYYVIAIDSRAHGKSSYNGEKLTISKLSDDVIKVLEILDIKKANFLGFSDGGNVLINIALKKPDLINKMVLNGANLNPMGVLFRINLQIFFTYISLSIKSLFDEEFKQDKAVWKLMINEPNFTYKMISKIKNECLVIVGDHDMIYQRHTRKMTDSMANARLVVMDGSHFIAEEEPQEFNKNIEQFLNNQASY